MGGWVGGWVGGWDVPATTHFPIKFMISTMAVTDTGFPTKGLSTPSISPWSSWRISPPCVFERWVGGWVGGLIDGMVH